MSGRSIVGKRPAFSASGALEAIGSALRHIKVEDGLTWADVGAVLGVSDDQAAKYAEGTATMNAVTFGRGKREWNGRFTGPFDRLCETSRPGGDCDHSTLTAVLDLGVRISRALEDGSFDLADVRNNRRQLEDVRDAIEAQLHRLVPSDSTVGA